MCENLLLETPRFFKQDNVKYVRFLRHIHKNEAEVSKMLQLIKNCLKKSKLKNNLVLPKSSVDQS